jgi:WD40 repeat protein
MNPKAVAAAEFYGRLRVHSSGYGKLVPDRIYSICMHPSRDSIIGFVGDKFGLTPIILFSSSFFSLQISFSASGKLGIVNYGTSIDAFKSSSIPFADMDAEFAQKRVCLEAHKETISCIAFPRSSIGANCDAAATSVFTSSYDGSIRALDIDRAIFFDIAVRAADDEYLVHSIRFIDSHTLWYSTSDGDIRMADVRSSAADNAKMPSHKVHSKKVGCVDVKNQSTLLTASNDATIALWDSRYMKKNPSPIDSFSSTCTMQCAYFSPSGDTIVAQNARDMNFLFFEGSTSTFSSGGFNAASALKVPHNNNTGRFTTTFRSVWDPKYDRVFCIGSMDQPRGFDVFGANYSFSKPASLDFRAKVTGALVTNVPASLAPHGSLPVVFAGNSSGRVTLFISP